MRRSAIVLLVLYALLGVLAGLMSSPVLLFYAVFLSGGFALPLMFAPGLFVYGAALVPALVAYGLRLPWVWVVPIAVVPVALLAFGPSTVARLTADAELATLRGADFEARKPWTPPTIEFTRRVNFHGGADGGGADGMLRDAVCDPTCQKLLLNGEVERVVIAGVQASGPTEHRVGYTREQRPTCPPAILSADDILPETTVAAAHGTCIVPTVNDDTPVAVTVRDFWYYPHERAFEGPPPAFGVTPKRIRRLEIIDRTKAAPVVVEHRTETTLSVLGMPLLLLPEGTGQQLEIRQQWWHPTVVDNPIDIDRVLRQSLRYKVAEIAGFASSDNEELLRLLLDRPGDQPIGADGDRLLGDVMKSFAARPALDATAVALVGDVIADHRIKYVMSVGDVLRRHPQLTRQFMPEIVARLAAQETAGIPETYSPLAIEIMRLSTPELRPYAARLVAFVENDARWAWVFIPRLGELAEDPVALLARTLVSGSIAYQRASVTGICRLDPAMAASLVEPLIHYLAGVEIRHTAPREFVTGIVALRRFGRDDAAERLVAGLTPRQVDALNRNLARRQPGYTVDSCGLQSSRASASR